MIETIRKDKKRHENAIKALEGRALQEERVDEDDYSARLGVADDLSSLEHFERRGVLISPWVWFGSMRSEIQNATIDRYPDLISTGVTIKWTCPECHSVLYVTREELLNHLNECEMGCLEETQEYTCPSINT